MCWFVLLPAQKHAHESKDEQTSKQDVVSYIHIWLFIIIYLVYVNLYKTLYIKRSAIM